MPSGIRDDILDAGINENKRISTTAEHLYQVMNTKLDWTDETMQSTFRRKILPSPPLTIPQAV
ncbi:hypothetical protein IMZ48_28160 [Candidatus Bathyarchaeota archaeon]|nr:hypothetical protein [Candidatus Bathyarchaeota archaeon]